MKIRFLIVTMLIAILLVCGCSAEQPSTEESHEHLLDEGLTDAAMDTVIRFNESGMRRTTPATEIPQEFWAPEIEALKPRKVYWHNNNLAIVLRDSSGEVDGMYICVPISSYSPGSGDTIQLIFGQETYTFKVKRGA